MSRRAFLAAAAGAGCCVTATSAEAAFYSGYFSVGSASMEPTLREGEWLLTDTTYYRSYPPQRAEVAIYSHPRQASFRYLKRITAIAGDRIAVRQGRAIVNGAPLDEPYIAIGDPAAFFNSTRELSVPEGHVFMLGDNRANSADSRVAAHGTVPVANLAGRASYIALSRDFTRIGTWVGTPSGR